MTDAQRHAWERARARITRLQPDVAVAVLAAFRIVLASVSEAELTRLVATGAIDRIVTALLTGTVVDRATLPLRTALRTAMERTFRFNVPYLPKGGTVDGTIAVAFDQLNPRVLDAIRTLETRVVSEMAGAMRESVRQALARGLEAQQAPATIARAVRQAVSLSPSQDAAIATYRALLEAGDRQALNRLLRDRRFDRTLERALGPNGTGLSPSQIDAMTAAYRRKAEARNAETISRTATTDAYKIATRESWQSAIDRGIVDAGSLQRQWIGVDDDRERDSHRAMNDEIAPFDAPYSNGQMYPGEGEFNCRCIDLFIIG